MHLEPCWHTAVQREPNWGSPTALNQHVSCVSVPAQLAASAARSGTRATALTAGSSLPAHRCYSNQRSINYSIAILNISLRTFMFCLFGFDVHSLQILIYHCKAMMLKISHCVDTKSQKLLFFVTSLNILNKSCKCK